MKVCASFLGIAPVRQDIRRNTPGQQALARSRAKDDPRALGGTMIDLPPKRRQLLIVHPVLGIEQHDALDGPGWRLGQHIGQGCMPDIEPADPRPYGRKIPFFQVWRYAAAEGRIVLTSKSLMGKIVFLDRKAASKLLDPLPQYAMKPDVLVAGQRGILRRRYAQTVQRSRMPHDPAQKPVIEERRYGLVEYLALLVQRGGIGEFADIHTQQPAQAVTDPDKPSQQSGAIKAARESRNAAAAEHVALLPIAPGLFIQMG